MTNFLDFTVSWLAVSRVYRRRRSSTERKAVNEEEAERDISFVWRAYIEVVDSNIEVIVIEVPFSFIHESEYQLVISNCSYKVGVIAPNCTAIRNRQHLLR